MLDLIIKNGLVVAPGQTAVRDIGITDGKIVLLSRPGTIIIEAAQIINAEGKIVIPGGIEPHAHIYEPMYRGWTGGNEVWLQSPEAATRAAAFGGTTTVLSFAFMDVHTTEVEFDANIAVEHRNRVFQGHSYIDYAFHPVLTGTPSLDTIAGLVDTIADGTPSFKFFTTDVTTGQDGIKIPNGHMLEAMKVIAEHNGIAMVHAEDDELLKFMEAKLVSEGRDELYNVKLVHTELGDEIAFREVIRLAQEAGAAVYFAHVMGRGGAKAIATARSKGIPIYGEVIHDALCFTAEDYLKPDGGKYHIGVSLRTAEDQEILWEALKTGVLSTVGTDEYTTSFDVKTRGKTILTAAGGHVGIETRGMIAFSEGVMKNRISLERFVELFSSNPAKILGLYPQKGIIAPGSDADLVLWDQKVRKTITMGDLHHEGDYSPWEGWEVRGWPTTTILHGKVIVQDGKLFGNPKEGRFIERTMLPDTLSNPATIS